MLDRATGEDLGQSGLFKRLPVNGHGRASSPPRVEHPLWAGHNGGPVA